MKFAIILATAGAVLIVSVPAHAQSADQPAQEFESQDAPSGGFVAGVTAGSLGFGPEITYRLSDSLGVRANATFFGLNRNVDSDGIEYDGDLKLRSFGAMLDFHPFRGGFRISAGARINSNRVNLSATPTESVEIGDDTYTPAQIGVLSGRVEAKNLAPALTIGYGGGRTPGVKFGIEAGALFQGSPRINGLQTTGTLSTNATFQASLRQEEREIEDDIKQFKVYPIVQISLGYRF